MNLFPPKTVSSLTLIHPAKENIQCLGINILFHLLLLLSFICSIQKEKSRFVNIFIYIHDLFAVLQFSSRLLHSFSFPLSSSWFSIVSRQKYCFQHVVLFTSHTPSLPSLFQSGRTATDIPKTMINFSLFIFFYLHTHKVETVV